MTGWLMFFFGLFLASLGYASHISYAKNRSLDEFMCAGSAIAAILGFLTFSAAVFSAFAFMGMPDFFLVPGIGAWIFLVLLVIVGFAGASMIAPVVVGEVIFKHPHKSLLVVSALSLGYFVLSLLEWVPAGFAGLPTDAAMYSILIPMSAIFMVWHHFTQKSTHEA